MIENLIDSIFLLAKGVLFTVNHLFAGGFDAVSELSSNVF